MVRRGRDEGGRIGWKNIMPGGLAVKYRILTNTDDVLEGVEKLCQSGMVVYAIAAVEFLLARNNTLLVPPTAEPVSCVAFDVSDMEDEFTTNAGDSYAIGFMYYSLEKGRYEFACIVVDKITGMLRPCSVTEAQAAQRLLEAGQARAGGGE